MRPAVFPMTADHVAILFLLGYAALTLLCVAWHVYRSRAGWLVWALYAIERLYVGLVFHWRSNRRSNIPQEGPALIIANHRSPVDPQFIWANHHLAGPGRRIRVISFLVAREYHDVLATRWICRAMQSIPVGRDGKDMAPAREALRRLEQGQLVGVFPEGRINLGESGAPLLPGDPGVAWLALRAKVPVIPVYIHNAPGCLNMVAPFVTPSRVRVCFGNPIDLSAYADKRATRDVLQEVTDLLMSKLEETGRDAAAPAVSSDDYDSRILPLRRVAN